jgi:acyl-CoA thioester hydrolase
MTPMEGYRYVHRRGVEFSDLDAAGHVNNAVYLRYLETARIDYMVEVLGLRSLDEVAVIVASLTIDFRSPAVFGDQLVIGARVPRIGTKSFDMDHEIRAADGRLVAEAKSVLVAFDYERRESSPVPSEWRERMEAFDAGSVAAA